MVVPAVRPRSAELRLAAAQVIIALAVFILVHGPSGQTFFVNPRQITSLREPVGSDRKHFPPGTKCVISETDGKFVPVKERCAEVRSLIGESP